MLGLFYWWGEYGSFVEGTPWIRAAAEQGHREAQYMLAAEYGQGHNIEHNPEEAARLYRLAAGSGHLEAQYNLGMMYFSGELGEKDIKQATKWMETSANSGFEPAQDFLMEAYRQPYIGFSIDKEKSAYWEKILDKIKP